METKIIHFRTQTQRNSSLRLSLFQKGKTHKAKVKFYDASSKEFNISIDEEIIKNQYEVYIEQ
jgi:hypothetical protein